jgi:hypothetical protein
MDQIFKWTPLIWTVRVLSLVLVFIVLLYLIRFFRWSNIKSIAGGRPPSVQSVKLLGAELVLHKELVDLQDEQLKALSTGLREAEDRIERLESKLHEQAARLVDGTDDYDDEQEAWSRGR